MKVAVVIPSYKVKDHILSVIGRIGACVDVIYVVDDKCPHGTGRFVEERCGDTRVRVIFHDHNQGVGGATMTGYQAALVEGVDIVVKLDGDGQMDPALIPVLISPIQRGVADYTKGNRFYALENLEGMPVLRKVGNAGLSFISKVSSGYWHVMDPANGYTAIHATALSLLPLAKIDRRYFFESDMLFRLNTIRAVVREVPMRALYGTEKSNLSVMRVFCEFPGKHLNRLCKRIAYNYILRDFNVCSIEMLSGAVLVLFGTLFGVYHWYRSALLNGPTPTGTIMLSVLPIMIGVQLLLAAVSFDVANVANDPLQGILGQPTERERFFRARQQAANDG